MRWLWQNYSLSIVLFLLFVVSWVGRTATGWVEFNAEQQQHGQVAQVFGSEGYFWPWAQATLENWQSEFLQLLTFVILTAYLIHRGSHESKDSDEEMVARLERIERRLETLARQTSPDLNRANPAPLVEQVRPRYRRTTPRPTGSAAGSGDLAPGLPRWCFTLPGVALDRRAPTRQSPASGPARGRPAARCRQPPRPGRAGA